MLTRTSHSPGGISGAPGRAGNHRRNGHRGIKFINGSFLPPLLLRAPVSSLVGRDGPGLITESVWMLREVCTVGREGRVVME